MEGACIEEEEEEQEQEEQEEEMPKETEKMQVEDAKRDGEDASYVKRAAEDADADAGLGPDAAAGQRLRGTDDAGQGAPAPTCPTERSAAHCLTAADAQDAGQDAGARAHTSAYVSIRQHTSAYGQDAGAGASLGTEMKRVAGRIKSALQGKLS